MFKVAPLILVFLIIMAISGCLSSSDDEVGQIKARVFGKECGENVTLRIDDRVFYVGFVALGVGVEAFTGNVSTGVHLVSIEYRGGLQEKRVVGVSSDECMVVEFYLYREIL